MTGEIGKRSRLSARTPVPALAGLTFALLAPSFPEMQRWLGLPAAVALTAAGTGALALLPLLSRALEARARPRAADWIAAGVLALVLVAVLVVHPQVDVQRPGAGSDRDDALSVAVSELLAGRHPYGRPTYLGNPVTPMPGALLLATPFVLLGGVALQNVFWLAALYLAARALLGDARPALLLLLATLAAPAVLRELATGGDLFANGVYVAVCLLLAVDRARGRRGAALASAALLGITLSSRPTYLFVLPLLAAHLARTAGSRAAFRTTGAALAAFALVTVPLWAYAPERFAPLHVARKLAYAGSVLPLAHATPVLTAALALCLARSTSPASLLARCAAVVAFPTLLLAALAAVSAALPVGPYLALGVGAAGPAVLGFGALLLGRGATDTAAPVRSGDD